MIRPTLLAGMLLALATAARAQAPRLGSISFPTSGARRAQPSFIRGMLYLHSFEYDSALAAFRAAERLDPGFALAYWGDAMTWNHPVWFQQNADSARAALARLAPTAAARRDKAKTERERRYLDAVETLYGGGTKPARDTLYAAAMEQLAADYPADAEAQTLYALALLGLSHNGRDLPTYMRAAAICEEVFRANPDHPGAAHYLIHSYDDPVHAVLGLRAARAYSKIAPAAPHAQHMTSHIFMALGMWDETVAANEIASRMTGRASGHYMYWLLYAYLQQGRYAEAREVFDAMRRDVAADPRRGKRFHLALARAAYLGATGEWDGAIAETAIDTTGLDETLFVVDLMDGRRALAHGDTTTARAAEARLGQRLEAARADTDYATGTMLGTVAIITTDLRARLLAAEGRRDEAIALLREATAREDALPFEFGPPETIEPPHELLGELLLAGGAYPDAAGEFTRALARAPRRTNSLAGLAEAAQASGDSATAEHAIAELRRNWKGQASDRPKVIALDP